MMQCIRSLVFSLCLIAMICGVSGCDVLSPIKTYPVATYTISDWHTETQVRATKPRSHSTLLVTTPVASPGYTTSQMMYVTIPFKLRAFASHQWVAPPNQLLLPLLAGRIEKTGYFDAVMTPPFSGFSHFQLDTRLLLLQQEFLKPVSEVHVIMRATVLNLTTNRVIATRLFDMTVPAPENDPYGGVVAANKAASEICNRMAQFVLRVCQ